MALLLTLAIQGGAPGSVPPVALRPGVRIGEVRSLGPDETFASFLARGEVAIEFPMLQAEAWGAREDDELDDFSLDDPDEVFGQATVRTRVEVTAEADYNADTGEFDNWEITSATRR